MTGMSDSRSARLFFWFLWLSGFALGFFLVGQFIIHSLVQSNLQKAIPYAFGFVWQCCVQLVALKSYQNSNSSREPLLIQLFGSLALAIIVVSIMAFRT